MKNVFLLYIQFYFFIFIIFFFSPIYKKIFYYYVTFSLKNFNIKASSLQDIK